MRKGSNRSGRARTRSVDFQNIEGDSEVCLTIFEKDVLNNIRTLKDSPLEQMIAGEKAVEEQKQAIQDLRRLRRYVKYARLTPKQRQAYEFFFVAKRTGMTLRKLAKKLKITLSSAWARIHGAVLRLEKVKLRRQEGDMLRRVLSDVLYAGKLKKVFRLYFEKGWPPSIVAKSLHSNLSTIYANIQTIRILGYVYSTGEYIPWEEARKKICASVEKTSNKTSKMDQT